MIWVLVGEKSHWILIARQRWRIGEWGRNGSQSKKEGTTRHMSQSAVPDANSRGDWYLYLDKSSLLNLSTAIISVSLYYGRIYFRPAGDSGGPSKQRRPRVASINIGASHTSPMRSHGIVTSHHTGYCAGCHVRVPIC